MKDPTVALFQLFSNQWDNTQTTLVDPPEIHTGTYSRDDNLPAIVIYGGEGGPTGGGETAQSAWDAQGYPMQKVTSSCYIDVVAGSRDKLGGKVVDGESENPKKIRWEMFDHAHSILLENTPDPFRTLAPQSWNDIVDSSDAEDVKPIFRTQITARYTLYRKRQTA